MKKIFSYLICFTLVIGLNCELNAQIPALRIRTDPNILVHPDRSLSFGNGTGNPNNGSYSMEYWWGGLNFWKIPPTYQGGNFKMHLNDLGMLGVNMRAMQRIYTGNVGQNMNQWACYLWVNGRAASDGWFTYSDSSMKGDVINITNSMNKIMSMRPVSYVYKSRKFYGLDTVPDSLINENDSFKRMAVEQDKAKLNSLPEYESIPHYGFIAQELKRVCPTVVAELGPTEGVNLPEIVPLVVKGIQEQQGMIDSLKRKVDSLNLQIQQLRQEIINWQGRSIDTIGQSRTRLFQNNPNPFDVTTTISYFIDENITISSASIEVRDIMGNLKSTIALADKSGLGEVTYDGSNLTQSYYIYTLKVNGAVKDTKMFLIER